MARPLDRTALGLLAVGHMLNDVNQGAVPALLPFLVSDQGFSYAAASGVVLAVTLISGITQPLLGFYSDRHPISWLIPIGMLLGGLGLALTGVATSYPLLIACMLISGAGVAAYHPEAYRFANYVSGSSRASGMSIFTVGGNLGFALGPVIMTGAVVLFGLPGTLVFLIPAVVFAVILLFTLPRITRHRPTMGEQQAHAQANPTRWVPFSTVVAVIVLRTVVQYGLLAFVPLYLNQVRGLPIAQANLALVLISLAGADGTLLVGRFADRAGYKRSLLLVLVVLVPLLALFLITTGLVSWVALTFAGMASGASFAVAVVLSQSYAESNLGVASGIATGLAIGLGGLSAPFLGRAADLNGLTAVLWFLSLIPLVAALITLTLPAIKRHPVRVELATESPDLAI